MVRSTRGFCCKFARAILIGMPASTLDPVNAAIRNSLSKTASETNIDLQLAGATKKALLADIEFEAAGSYQTSVLDKLKTKYIVLKSSSESQQTR